MEAGGRSGGRGGRRRGRGGGGRSTKRGPSTADAMSNLSLRDKPPQQHKTQGEKKSGNRPKQRGGKNNNDKKAEERPVLTEEDKKRAAEAEQAKQEAAAREAERKREEEKQKAVEAAKEARKKRQTALEKRVKDACDSLTTLVETTRQHKESREQFAAEPLAKARKDFEANKKALKSDLRKCTAFVKKIKSGAAWSMRPDELTKDVATLNLSRYVEEVASALTESKLRLADLPNVVTLCRAMHARYADFVPTLLPSLWSTVQGKVTDDTAKLRRLYMRLITEFVLNGIVFETKQLMKVVAEATGGANGTYAVSDANLVVSFVKAAGFEILGTRPRSIQHDMDLLTEEISNANESSGTTEEKEGHDVTSDETPPIIPKELADKASEILPHVEGAMTERAVPEKISEAFATHCIGAYETMSKSLVETHAKLQKLEKRCEQDRLVSGSLSEAREKGLTDARKLLESLQKSVESLSDVLLQKIPELEEKEEDGKADGSGVGLELWTKGSEVADGDFGPFDDEETRSFYCDTPDLLTTIPPALLGMSSEEIERLQAKNMQKYGSGFDAQQEIGEEDNEEVIPSSEVELESDEDAEEDKGSNDDQDDAGGEENKDTPHYRLMVLLEQELPECNRREQVDELAEKFCVNHGTSKNSRKRLSKTLFMVPRTRLDLLPLYSRFTAVIDRVFQDVAPSLVRDLEQQFHGQAKFKKNQNIESRLKTARYLGELTKSRVAPPIVSLRCLRRCLDDFNGFNVDVACCILETCGRYLYRTKHTTERLTALMDVMIKISKAKNLDERSKALINSAFYMVKPPAAAPKKNAKVYPPLEAYLRHLLLVRLVPEDDSVIFVTKQLNRFPWDDPAQQCGALICKYMMKACRKGRYKAITAVAAVTAKLRLPKPEIAARLVDAILEELRWSLEHPDFRDQQRSITYAKLLGELFSFGVASFEVVTQQLHQFLNLGHEIPEVLRQASEKYISENSKTDIHAKEELPVYNSARGISQAIQEDEEMEETPLESLEEKQEPRQQAVAVSRHSIYDPRVPTPTDPPNAVLRIKLVCTLLETTSKMLVTRNKLAFLDAFMAAFQRYLFTKATLPTEVEFSLLDTFDILDSRWKAAARDYGRSRKEEPLQSESGFTRYSSWLEAHNASVAMEEADAVMRSRQRARLEAHARISEGVDGASMAPEGVSLDGDEMDSAVFSIDDEDEFEDHLSVSVTETLSGDELDDEEDIGHETDDDSQADETSEDETSEGSIASGEDMDDEDESGEEEMDEEAYMRQLEEDAFERELRRVTMEALDKGKSTAKAATGGKVADYMPTGSQFIRKKPAEQSKAPDAPGAPVALGGKEGIAFQLLKKGNKGKVEAKQLVVPSDTNLARLATKQDDEAARERDLLKARVLQYEAESAEHEASGGNLYLEQSKLQVIRNRPLSIEQIDRNFGSTRGETPGSTNRRTSDSKPRSQPSSAGRGRGRGHGRGRGRGGSGRTLYR